MLLSGAAHPVHCNHARHSSNAVRFPGTARRFPCLISPCRLAQRRCNIVLPPHAAAAASDGGSADDPYKVLGLKTGADSERVQRAYRRAVNDAERAGDKSKIEKLEAAHTRIMMSGLSARLQGGGGEVAQEVKYADRAVFLPWRPRKYMAEKKFIKIVAGVQALLAAWAVLTPLTAGTQPLLASTIAGVVANAYKQNEIFPPPTSSTATNKNQTFKNLLRAALLTVIATFLGCWLFFTFPSLVSNLVTKGPLPVWFYQKETMILCIGATLSNFACSAFFR